MLGLSLSLSLGMRTYSGGSGPTPPPKPVLLTAPTVTLIDDTHATITLGTFSGADSTSHDLLVDGVRVADAVAGTLDVSGYAGSAVAVRSTGINASGPTSSTSAAVSVPEAGYTFEDTFSVENPSQAGLNGWTEPGTGGGWVSTAAGNIKSPSFDKTSLLIHDAGAADCYVEVDYIAGADYSEGGTGGIVLAYSETGDYYRIVRNINVAGRLDIERGNKSVPLGDGVYIGGFGSHALDANYTVRLKIFTDENAHQIVQAYVNDGAGFVQSGSDFDATSQSIDGTSAVGLQGWQVECVTAFRCGSLAPPAADVIPATTLFMNVGAATQWSGGNQFRDIGMRGEWRSGGGDVAAFAYIGARDMPLSDTVQILSDGVGSATTVKMDYDGRIYKDNGCAGLTNILFLFPFVFTSGDYDIQLPADLAPGDVVMQGSNFSNFVYNSTTGVATATLTSDPTLTGAPRLNILVSAIPDTGFPQPTAYLHSDASRNLIWTDEALDNFDPICSGLRFMSSHGVVGDLMPGATLTDFAMRSPAQIWHGSTGMAAMPVEMCVEACARKGKGIWWNIRGFDDDSVIAHEAAVLATLGTALPVRVAYSNELWNTAGPFTQGVNARLMACRRGYDDLAVTKAADATPKRITDTRGYLAGNTLGLAIANDAYFFCAQENVGWVVYKALKDLPVGTVLPMGVTNADVALVSGPNAVTVAMYRFQSTRTKEIKAIYDAAFTTAGRSLPSYVIENQTGDFSDKFKDYLDWDDAWAIEPDVAQAWYWYGSNDNNIGTYGIPFTDFGEAQRDLAYKDDLTDFIGAFFAPTVAPAIVDASIAGHVATRRAARAYAVGKGLDQNAIGMSEYEWNWHIQFLGWPDQAPDWSAGATYSDKQFVRSGADGKTYRAKSAVPAGQDPTTATTYWAVFVDHNGTTWDAANTAKFRGSSARGDDAYCVKAYNALMRSQDFGGMVTRFLDGVKSFAGGTVSLFDGVGSPVLDRNKVINWDFSNSEGDTGVDNARYTALKDFKAGL